MKLQEDVAFLLLRTQLYFPPKLVSILKREFLSFSNILESPKNRFIDFLQQAITSDKNLNQYRNQLPNFIHNIENLTPIEPIIDDYSKKFVGWQDKGVKFLSIYDKDYPSLLRGIRNPPDYIFLRGELKKEDEKSVSIAGTRKFTLAGFHQARKLGSLFALNKYSIINGMARGIDLAAIIGALEVNGRVICVLGSGVLNIYPPEHEGLVEDIVKNGAIISLTLPEKNVSKGELQARNRITSALSKLNIFVEASLKSGTMWQYNYSKKQSKLIATVRPGDIQREQSRLPQLVIEEGGLVFDTNLSNFKEILSIIQKENNSKIDDFIDISPTNTPKDN